MDIHSVRQQLRARSIYEVPLRVTYYARVSSESDEQLNSLGNQIGYYEDLIRRNSAWSFVPGYIDEGLSGISTRRRENFNRMIDDAALGKFDLVITKEISRFARNTLDSIQYTRRLLSCGVGVFFQNDNINTFDEDSELRLSIMSSIAQDELRKLSSRVKFGHQQAIKQSVVLGNGRIFGYKKENKRLVIDEAQAPMVRRLFELYATGGYSMKQLETLFWESGYRNLRGGKLSHSTMSGMIANPKYKGWYVGNKVKVVDMFTKKQKFLPPEEWVMFRDESGLIVPAIVSEELWEQANEVLRRRSQDVKNRRGICNHQNLLTGKLWCAHCGRPYYRRQSRDSHGSVNSRWVCSGKINGGAGACPSRAIYEDEIKPLLFDVFRETGADDAQALIDEYVEMYKSLSDAGDTSKQLESLRRRIDLAEKKKSKLLMYNAMGELADGDFLSMNRACAQEIRDAQERLTELERQRLSKADLKKHLDNVRRVLEDAGRDASSGMITREFVDRYIRRITVTPDSGGMRLDIKLFTGEATEKYLSDLDSRSGHTFKKMIEAYENGLK